MMTGRHPGQAPLVASVRDLGVQFRPNEVGITGHDGCTGTVLPDGRAIWIFGDSITHAFNDVTQEELVGMLTGSACMVPPQDASQGIRVFEYLKAPDGSARPPVNFLPDENPGLLRLWAIHGSCLGRTMHLFYILVEIYPDKPPMRNFGLLGMGLARGDVDTFEFERLRAPDGSWCFWKDDRPTFGIFTHHDESDGYLYVFGAQFDKPLSSDGGRIHLARTRRETIADLASYEYLVEAPTLEDPGRAARWDREYSATAPLFNSVPNEMSISYNQHLGCYLVLHMDGCHQRCILRTAPAIAGPWSEPEYFHHPQDLDPGIFCYALKEHPELSREGGRVVYATYVDTVDYMPRLLEITFR